MDTNHKVPFVASISNSLSLLYLTYLILFVKSQKNWVGNNDQRPPSSSSCPRRDCYTPTDISPNLFLQIFMTNFTVSPDTLLQLFTVPLLESSSLYLTWISPFLQSSLHVPPTMDVKNRINLQYSTSNDAPASSLLFSSLDLNQESCKATERALLGHS